MKKRTICVVTGSRSEYGLLHKLLQEINGDRDLKLQIIVTGAHLSLEFGMTCRTIVKDGFRIDQKVNLRLDRDSPVGITRSLGLGVIGFGKALRRLHPDLVVLLGDRYEIFAAAQAAMIARIPIAHLHGGESTEGLIDEAIRHSITKMSHLHFVAAKPFRDRVIQLGEDPRRVFNFGAPGLESIKKMNLLNRKEFESAINFKLGKTNFLITYHPVTLSRTSPSNPVKELFRVLQRFPEAKIVFTKTHADLGGKVVNGMIDQYVTSHRLATSFVSMGRFLYLSALKNVDVVIGNSSSGIIEAPLLRTAAVNMGPRQDGRPRAASIIDCDENAKSILVAIRKALSPEFQKIVTATQSLYGCKNVNRRIKEKLKSTPLKNILFKKFYGNFSS